MTQDYDAHELSQMWRNGVSLWSAADVYFNARTITKFQRLEKVLSGGAVLRRFNKQLKEQRDFADFEVASQKQGAYDELERRMRRLVLDWIDSDQLIAVGFAIPRSPEDHPIRVPFDLWTAYHKLRTNTLSANGLQVDAIKLIVQKQINPTRKLAPAATITAEKRSAPGRPSLKEEIVSTYEYLRETGEVDYTGTMVQCCDLVRQSLIQEDPSIAKDGRGLGDKALAKHLGSFFREDKEDYFSQ